MSLAFEVGEDRGRLLAAGGGLAEPCEAGGLRAAAGDGLDLDAAPVVGDAAGGGAEAIGGEAGLGGEAAGSVAEAYRLARSLAGADDRIVVCGSFLTVAAVADLLISNT